MAVVNPMVSKSSGAKRVLHVFGSLARGGAETWLMDVMRHSDRSRMALDVCLVGNKDGAYEEEFAELGGKIFKIPLNGNPLKFYPVFRRLLNEEHYDAVHSHLYLFSGILLRAAAAAHVSQRIAHIHPIEDVKEKQKLRALYAGWMRRWIVKFGTHFVAPTEQGLVSFWGSDWATDGNKSVIYNGLKADRFRESVDRAAFRKELDLPSTAKVALNVARFAPHKRQRFLIDVAEALFKLENTEDIYFVLLGAGDLRDETIRAAEEKGIADRMRFVSGAPSIDRFWLAADAFAFPSSNEGFGIVVAEAAAAGLPVIAQDIPGVSEAAKACHDVELLSLDTPAEKWASHLLKALQSGPLTDKERNERLDSFRFTIENSIASLEQLYHRTK